VTAYWQRYHLILIGHAILLPPIGYVIRFSPVLPEWFRNLWGNVAYEMLWIFVALSIAPKLRPKAVAVAVCLITFVIEFLQLWHHPVLEAARSTLPGRLILASGFDPIDLLQYVLGSAIGWWWASRLRQWFAARPAA
jgi:glycopeptide antibiotics resistance protein